MKKRIAAALAGTLVLMATCASAQKISPQAEFGKIQKKDLELQAYDKDPGAAAVILFDYGLCEFAFSQSTFKRHKRIKIFKKEGYEWGNDLIPLIEVGARDRITTLKAATYNLVDGAIQQSLLPATSSFKEQLNDDIKLIRFAMPDVREGCIIEIYYEVANTWFTNWTFQQTIPTVLSDYTFSIVTGINVNFVIQGYLTPEIKDGYGYLQGKECRTLHMVMQDVPAFEPEPHISSMQDYIARARFYLTSLKVNLGNYYTASWYASVTQWSQVPAAYKQSQLSEEIGSASTSFLQKPAREITQNCKTQDEKLIALHQHVRSHFTWNRRNSISATGIRKAYEKKEGNSADINLTLLLMLRYAGVMAEPVLISTKENGMVRPDMPTLTQFNRVIIQSSMNGRNVYLDATDKSLPHDYLPLPSAVLLGYVAAESHPGWVELTSLSKTAITTRADLTLSAEGKLSGTLTVEKNGYEAAASRKKYKDLGEKEYTDNVYKPTDAITIANASFTNAETPGASFKEMYTIETNTEGNTGNFDILYLNPILTDRLLENPFRETDRVFPVDLGFPKTISYQAKIKIPAGYSVDEIPKPKLSMLPGNTAKFMYNATHSENEVVVICQVALNRSHFIQDEYPDLREFMNIVLAKQAEQIVLKKK